MELKPFYFASIDAKKMSKIIREWELYNGESYFDYFEEVIGNEWFFLGVIMGKYPKLTRDLLDLVNEEDIYSTSIEHAIRYHYLPNNLEWNEKSHMSALLVMCEVICMFEHLREKFEESLIEECNRLEDDEFIQSIIEILTTK